MHVVFMIRFSALKTLPYETSCLWAYHTLSEGEQGAPPMGFTGSRCLASSARFFFSASAAASFASSSAVGSSGSPSFRRRSRLSSAAPQAKVQSSSGLLALGTMQMQLVWQELDGWRAKGSAAVPDISDTHNIGAHTVGSGCMSEV